MTTNPRIDKFALLLMQLAKKDNNYVLEDNSARYVVNYPNGSKESIIITFVGRYDYGRFGRQEKDWIVIDGGYYGGKGFKKILRRVSLSTATPEKVHTKVREVALELGGIYDRKQAKKNKGEELLTLLRSWGFDVYKNEYDDYPKIIILRGKESYDTKTVDIKPSSDGYFVIYGEKKFNVKTREELVDLISHLKSLAKYPMW